MSAKPTSKHYNIVQQIINKTRHPVIYGLNYHQKKEKIKQIWNQLNSTEEWEMIISELQLKHESFISSPPAKIKTKSIKSYFSTASSSNNNRSEPLTTISPSISSSTISTPSKQSKPTTTTTTRIYTAPQQERISKDIKVLKEKMVAMKKYCIYFKIHDQDQYLQFKQKLYEMNADLKQLNIKLKKVKSKAKAQKRWRQGRRKQETEIKNKLEELGVIDDLTEDIKIRDRPGRPRIEETRSGALLAATMTEVAAPFTTTNPRRRAEENIVNISLSKFAEEVNENIQHKLDEKGIKGKKISSSTMYNRTS